jgi:hypothetical protein
MGRAPFYFVGYTDCIHFCATGLRAAGVGVTAGPGVIPNVSAGFLAGWAHVTYTNDEWSVMRKKGKLEETRSTPDVNSTVCFEGQAGCVIHK